MEEISWIRRTRFLSQALMLSGGLNICLIATFVYFVSQDKRSSLSVKTQATGEVSIAKRSNEELLQAYSFLPFSELLLRLETLEPLEEGLCKRDLALACLVAFHHFPLEKSLGGFSPQTRQIAMHNIGGQEAILVNVFPGLSDFQFQAISHFAKTEKWPLSSQGLFYELKRQAGSYEESLLEAFYLTPEFHQVATLFLKTGLGLSKTEIIELLTSGEWSSLVEGIKKQKEGGEVSLEARRAFLLSYFPFHSKMAAELLFKSDPEFALKKLSDIDMLFLLSILKEKNISCEEFVKEVLQAPRTDQVRSLAASLHPGVQSALLVQEVQEITPQRPLEKARGSKVFHTVGSGDTLWKIARKYKVSVEALIRLNHLESEKLKIGKSLEIPSANS